MSAKFMKNAFVGWTFTHGLYYPPDFDQSKLMPLKHLKPKGPQMMNIRMMFPFTMICDECKEYNYTGTKFTSKVEQIKHETYLGIKVYRFYGRCRHCWSEFTFKTDPKNSDYTMESGGKRTYEAWKDADMMENALKEEKERDAANDHMKALEQKSINVQAEMQMLEDLDSIRTMNKRLGQRDKTIEEALHYLFQREEKKVAEEAELPEADLAELSNFRAAQDELRQAGTAEGEPPSSEAASTAGGASGSTGASGTTGAAAARAAGAAMAAAAAESASSRKPAAGARFSIKRKLPATEADEDRGKKQAAASRESVALNGCASSSSDGNPQAPLPDASRPEPVATKSDPSSGGLGLGSYDSSDSS